MTELNDDTITKFILDIMNFLAERNMCFERGAFVFEDLDAKLYNLLSFNKLTLPKYDCNNPPFSRATNLLSSPTHTGFIKKFGFADCVPYHIPRAKKALSCRKSKDGHYKCMKLERLFLLDNKPVYRICENTNHMEKGGMSKSVILYYPFQVNLASSSGHGHNTIKMSKKTSIRTSARTRKSRLTINTRNNKAARMLYFKLEEYPMRSFKHAIQFIKTLTKIPIKTSFPTRKEGTLGHEPYTFQSKDEEFYSNLPNGLNQSESPKLKNYNQHIRIGNEFFISQGLLKYFFRKYLSSTKM